MILKNLPGKILEQKYRIEKQLGQGGMGAVFLATHLGTRRPVAVKVIAPKYMNDKQFVERFKREAMATGRLRHPNVVNVTDFGFTRLENSQIAYLVMEYLDGETLGDMIEQAGPLPLTLFFDIAEQICLAIDKAHRFGIVHRDLKPQNIWLEPNERGGYNVKVLDFGLAKLHDSALTTSEQPSTVSPISVPLKENPKSLPSDRLLTEQPTEVLPGLGQEQSRQINHDFGSPVAIAGSQTENYDEIFAGEDSVLTEVDSADALQSEPLDPDNASDDAQIVGNGIPKTRKRDVLTRQTPLEALPTEQLTKVGAILGTPLYMSPEQSQGQKIDARSDIYSLGLVLYQMIGGKPPFSGSFHNLIIQHTQKQAQPLRKIRRDIPIALEKLIMSTLAKDPQQRPPTCKALAVKLQSIANGEIPIIHQAKNIHRRHRRQLWVLNAFCYAPFIIIIHLTAIISPNYYPFFALILIPFATSLNIAAHTLFVSQLPGNFWKTIPLFPIGVRLFQALPALVATAGKNLALILLRGAKLFYPGIKTSLEHCLYSPVVIMERKSGQPALDRSRYLVDQMRCTARAVRLYDFLIYLIIILVLLSTCNHLIASIRTTKSWWFAVVIGSMTATIGIAITVLMSLGHSPYAVAFTLLYFKTRQAAGENLPEIPNEGFLQLSTPVITRMTRTLALLAYLLITRLVLSMLIYGLLTIVAYLIMGCVYLLWGMRFIF